MKKSMINYVLLSFTLPLLLVSAQSYADDWHQNPEGLWYLGYKIPAIDKPWGSQDYKHMLTVLKVIKKEKPDALPRRSGEYTGPVYKRMISRENFRPQLQIYGPIEVRREEAAQVLFTLKEIMREYFDFKANKQPYGAEALGLMAYSIRQQAILFTITVEFWLTLSTKDQQNPDRLQGLHASKQAAAALAGSALDYLSLDTQFEAHELTVYAYELVDIFPELFVHLTQQDKQKIKGKVKKISTEHNKDTVRDAMGQLNAILQQL